MSFLPIEFRQGSPYLPAQGLWLDAREPQVDRVFVSHAHSDHTAEHKEVILSAPTAKLMQARLPGTRNEHILDFGERRRFEYRNASFEITLFPAGHIFGSAMSLIQAGGERLLYTGDFKLRPGLSAEPCQAPRADILIMETTYGRPQYVFPPTEAVLERVIEFCRETLNNGETAVLLGYSLGKSQELLCRLGDAGLPLMLHGAVFRLTQIYQQFGQCFPKYERYEAGSARGKVLLCPPNVVNSAMLRNLGKSRTAILTGWAVEPNCLFRYQCDAAFPLSDHADFPDLLEMVTRVQPKKIYTLHGFAADFAQKLRESGYDAQALSEDEQLALGLAETSKRPRRGVVKQEGSPESVQPDRDANVAADRKVHAPASKTLFYRLALTCARISGTASKLEKVQYLADYLQSLTGRAVGLAATWFSGRPFPSSENKVLQLGWAVLRNALCAVAGVDEAAIVRVYSKHSDLGETAGELLENRQAEPLLSLREIEELFENLRKTRGPLAKTPLLIRVLERCTSLEAKYLVKIITGDLRIGLKEGLVEEAVAAAFKKPAEQVQRASLLLGDIGETARLAAEDRLSEARIMPFRAVKVMLASAEETAVGVWERMACPADEANDAAGGTTAADECARTVWVEDKYDGIRCQLHKVGQRVALYSRDLKEVTTTFPELAEGARQIPSDIIFDGEIVAMRDDEVFPFAELQKRLGRKEADLFMREEVPIRFVVFDVLWKDGESYLERALNERRQGLESLGPLPRCFRVAQINQASSADDIEAAFEAARARGNEGLVIKNPRSFYTPGRRGLAWLKLKKAFATLDCVVVGAEYGHGKRNKVLSDYTFAVRDEQTRELKTIGKAYTGLTDAEIAELTEHFHRTAIRQHGRYFEVQPDTVLEIAFDRIQSSDRHNSGLALRFPRIVRIRTDKSVEEIDTLANARRLAKVGKEDGKRIL